MAKGFNFGLIRKKLEQTKRLLPIAVAKLTENHFADAFKTGNLDEYKWAEVNRRIAGTKEYKYPKKRGLSRRTSPILVRTGNLRRKTARSTRIATWGLIKLVNSAPYSGYMNEGTATVEARPFMKQTDRLTTKQKKEIKNQMDKIWTV